MYNNNINEEVFLVLDKYGVKKSKLTNRGKEAVVRSLIDMRIEELGYHKAQQKIYELDGEKDLLEEAIKGLPKIKILQERIDKNNHTLENIVASRIPFAKLEKINEKSSKNRRSKRHS